MGAEGYRHTIPEKAVHLGKANLKAVVTHEAEFDFGGRIDIDGLIAISSPISPNVGSVEIERTSSDGRAGGVFVDKGFTVLMGHDTPIS